MLTRIRIEVSDEDSAAAVTEELDRYERAITASEETRYGRKLGQSAHEILDRTSPLRLDSPDDFLGREITDEVIEYDPSLPGYKGRRVVQFKRLDTRSETLRSSQGTEGVGTSSVTIKGPSLNIA